MESGLHWGNELTTILDHLPLLPLSTHTSLTLWFVTFEQRNGHSLKVKSQSCVSPQQRPKRTPLSPFCDSPGEDVISVDLQPKGTEVKFSFTAFLGLRAVA